MGLSELWNIALRASPRPACPMKLVAKPTEAKSLVGDSARGEASRMTST
jgi:hypothetical protein